MTSSKKDKRLVIMITGTNGSKFINVDMIYRQIAYYVVTFICTLVLFAFASVMIINKEINDTRLRNENLLSQFSDMQSKNEALSKLLAQKDEEIALVGDRFENIESSIGFKKEDSIESSEIESIKDSNIVANNMQDSILRDVNAESAESSLIQRMDATSISALQKSFIMKLIPNGSPLGSEPRISGNYGKRYHPVLKIYHIHTGTDMAAVINTPVYATADGVVDWASSSGNGGYGKLVKISHAFGFRTYYAHLNDIKVQRGEFVKKGQLIALTGSTGTSTGPHLHYEIRFLGQPLDPINFVHWDMQNFNSIFEKERRITWDSLVEMINNLMGKRQQEAQRQSSLQTQDSKVK